jgi:hypothetical protein
VIIINDKDHKVLNDFLNAYKECFEAQNDLLNKIAERVPLNEQEKEMAKVCDMKYKNMLYHMRKWHPNFRKTGT